MLGGFFLFYVFLGSINLLLQGKCALVQVTTFEICLVVLFPNLFDFSLELPGFGVQTLKILGSVFKVPLKLVDGTLELISGCFMPGHLFVLGCSFLLDPFNRRIELCKFGSMLEIRVFQRLK